jgi:hypothetical protein
MRFTNGFDCAQYDGKTPCLCPAWMALLQENPTTGETRILKDCQFRLSPIIWMELIKSANRPAAAVESARNEIDAGFSRLAEVVSSMPPLLARDK